MRYVRVVQATALSQLFFNIDVIIGNQYMNQLINVHVNQTWRVKTDVIDRRLLVKPLASGVKPRDYDIDLQDINI